MGLTYDFMGNVSSQIETILTTVALYPCTLVKPFPVACCNETVASLQPEPVYQRQSHLPTQPYPFPFSDSLLIRLPFGK